MMDKNLIEKVDISVALELNQATEILNVQEIADKHQIKLEDVSEKLGLHYLQKAISKYIDNYSEQFFFEYSIICSSLNANSMNYLTSLACIYDASDSKEFMKSIKEDIKNVIDSFVKDNTTNLFHNPALFIAPREVEAIHSINNETVSNYIEHKKDNIMFFGDLDDRKNSIANFSYKRSYDDIINSAKIIKQNNGNNMNQSKEQEHTKVHKTYNSIFHTGGLTTGYISIPILGASASNIPDIYNTLIDDTYKFQGQGVLFLYFTIKPDKIDDLKTNIEIIKNNLFDEIGDLIRLFVFNYIFNNGLNLLKRVKQESIKSAISAIMSRNMSHNLGSHLITNAKNYIGREADKHNTDEQLAADLRGIRHLLQYMQERMDYVATITSGDRYPLGSLNFKSQLLDELTIDDFSKRHNTKKVSNFFLKYLVYSEKYTHDNGGGIDNGYKGLNLLVKYIDKDGKLFCFDPVKDKDSDVSNDTAKNEISKLNFAVPGGMMSRHAFFNIVENIIRNSAKHSRKNNEESLTITIEFNRKAAEDAGKKDYCRISIYDNKDGGEETMREIEDRLKEIRILTPKGELEKNNKGLKEMLISALWLQGKTVFKELIDIDNETVSDEKIKKIKEILNSTYFSNGGIENFGYSFDVKLFKPVHKIEVVVEKDKNGNPIPKPINANTLLDICADVVTCEYDKLSIVNNEKEIIKELKKLFPRFIHLTEENKEKSDEELFEICLKSLTKSNNLPVDLSKFVINIQSKMYENEQQMDGVKYDQFNKEDENCHIVFENHLNSNEDKQEKYTNKNGKGYGDETIYLDSISGGDFTSTIVQPVFLDDKIQRNKVIESAITSITIIDERIFQKVNIKPLIEENVFECIKDYINNKMLSYKENDAIVALTKFDTQFGEKVKKTLEKYKKNISDYNFSNENTRKFILEELYHMKESLNELVARRKKSFVFDLEFDTGKGIVRNVNNQTVAEISNEGVILLKDGFKIEKSMFVTIHLGLLEKYRDFVVKQSDEQDKSKIIKQIMNQIKETFTDNKQECFIAIHSGRGNFSKELEDDLESYPFLSLSSLEAVYDNSKFLLSQLFYNTVYYGKGNFNNE
jgi:hypothetical protein